MTQLCPNFLYKPDRDNDRYGFPATPIVASDSRTLHIISSHAAKKGVNTLCGRVLKNMYPVNERDPYCHQCYDRAKWVGEAILGGWFADGGAVGRRTE